jgi:large subunit ribosomal protein L19
MTNLIDEVEARYKRETPLGDFRVGDTVDVQVQIREGEKERVQIFTGTVIKIQGGNSITATFTVRRIVAGEGVERTFPFHSPVILTVEVRRKGKARRSRLFYLRDRIGKATRVKERRGDDPRLAAAAAKEAAASQAAEEPQEEAPAEEADEPRGEESSEAAAGVN